MDHEQQISAELQALRALCREETPAADREQIIKSLSAHFFSNPERQVVFESLRSLLARGGVSPERLRIHLNNRGFPDTDVEEYFQSAAPKDSHDHPQSEEIPGSDR
jgi:hypothetical protein